MSALVALHREVDARLTPTLREAAAKRSRARRHADDLDIPALAEQAMQAAGEARRPGIFARAGQVVHGGRGAAGEERVTWQDVASAEELAVR